VSCPPQYFASIRFFNVDAKVSADGWLKSQRHAACRYQFEEEADMKLDVKAFALASAIAWGLGLPLLTWWIIALDGPSTDPTWLGHIYRGYNLTLQGSIIGAVWAFSDGLIGGAIFAWLYDVIQMRVSHSHRKAA
jgi:hypothetical protein